MVIDDCFIIHVYSRYMNYKHRLLGTYLPQSQFGTLKLTHADARLKIITKTAVSQNLYMESAEL